ncbi:MAG: polymer-forming cytoskeletal protein [Candidatus Zixiibacteriota bacterium]|nr:MAG: polymer-forming cytoskeletal protein [candidate division Zixibacteria bacterium]
MLSPVKLKTIVFLLAPLAVLFLFNFSLATQFRSADNFFFPDTAIIHDDLVTTGGNIKLDGIIEGDLISVSRSLVQSGLILGSLNAMAQDVDVLGEVKGSVRAFGQNINVNGTLDRNLIALGYSVDVKAGAEIRKDISAFCGKMTLDGKLGGNLKGSVGELVVSGVVNQNISVEADKITLMPTARILGNLKYKSKKEAQIESGAQVSGETVWTQPKTTEEKEPKSIFTGKPIIPEILFLLALMVTGVVLTLICRKDAHQAKQALADSFLKSLALGFVAMVCVPIAVIILIISVIGIPIAVIALFAYAVLIYIAKIPVATFVGEKIIKGLGKEGRPSLVWSMLLGLVVLTLALNIPYLDWLIYFLVLFTGFGAIISSQKRSAA